MSLRTISVPLAATLFVLTAVSGCSGDKVQKARSIIETQPDVALALLKEAAAETGETFDNLIYTGLTLEKLGRDSEAIEVYEKALAGEGAAGRPEPVSERLLALYEKAHSLATGDAAKRAVARKAAALEKALKVARPWASSFIIDRLAADMAAAGEAGDEATVRKLAAEGMELAVTTEVKNMFGEKATAALRQAFVVRSEKAFMEKLAGPLSDQGFFVADGARIVIESEFVIPPAKIGPDFDPDNPQFFANVRKSACVPLHTSISNIAGQLAPVLGLKEIDAAGLDTVFENLYRTGTKAGFKAFGGDKRPPNGQTYLCRMDVGLRDFLAAVFVFAQ